MANNRMFLVHRPTGLSIMLGKRMGWGWYACPKGEKIQSFFEHLSDELSEPRQDDFILALEDCRESLCHQVVEYLYNGEGKFNRIKVEPQKEG